MGFSRFLEELGKVFILSMKSVNPGTDALFALRPPSIRHLSENQNTQELLYKTIYSWLFDGNPRTEDYIPLSDVHMEALDYLIPFSQRFVIAHEYGHFFMDKIIAKNPPPDLNIPWEKEWGADAFAFHLLIDSVRYLDHPPPNVSLQGGIFALSALDIILKARFLIHCGEVEEDKGTASHPPYKKRIEQLKSLYLNNLSLYRWLEEERIGKNMKIDLGIEGALLPSRTLYSLWELIQDRFVNMREKVEKREKLFGRAKGLDIFSP